MKRLNTQGFTIVYLIFIISIVVSLGMVVITKQAFLTTLAEKTQTQNILLDQASQRAVFQFKRFQNLAEEVKYDIS
jgi:exopolyphosphatase/pppGpp-phosphohydrolase